MPKFLINYQNCTTVTGCPNPYLIRHLLLNFVLDLLKNKGMQEQGVVLQEKSIKPGGVEVFYGKKSVEVEFSLRPSNINKDWRLLLSSQDEAAARAMLEKVTDYVQCNKGMLGVNDGTTAQLEVTLAKRIDEYLLGQGGIKNFPSRRRV